MTKITIAEVKRRLPVGAEFTGEFVGRNRSWCKPGMEVCRRLVVKQTWEMETELLDGPKVGTVSHLTWKGVTADDRDGSIYLTMTEVDPPEEFLKITIDPNRCAGTCEKAVSETQTLRETILS